jgi:hypothetical protein
MTDIRVTREAIEVVSVVDTTPAIQVTREAVEVLSVVDTTPTIQVTRFAAEVIITTAEATVGSLRRILITVNYH